MLILSSNLATYYGRQDFDPKVLQNLTQKDNKVSNLDNNVMSFIDQDKLYYSTCLTPGIETRTKSYNAITREYNTPKLLEPKVKNLIPWLMGQKLLQDDRCLWMELKLSPVSPESSTEMKSLWSTFLDYWMKNYPLP